MQIEWNIHAVASIFAMLGFLIPTVIGTMVGSDFAPFGFVIVAWLGLIFAASQGWI